MAIYLSKMAATMVGPRQRPQEQCCFGTVLFFTFLTYQGVFFFVSFFFFF